MTVDVTECDAALDLPMHSCSTQGTTFRLPTKYTVVEMVGQGAYGVVCSAMCAETGELVAIKKIENIFEHLSFTKRTLRELRILRHLQHENIIGVRDVFITDTKLQYEDVYVVSDLLETDLTSILKSPQDLSDDHIQFFAYQTLRGLKYLHSASIIHRDLKPRNLLVNANCDLKICDFGLARVHYVDDEFELCPLTEYICTRWYRAPEILCVGKYCQKVDIWAMGCILAEMLGRKAIFPGHNSHHQLQLIIGTLGSPTTDDMDRITNEACRTFIQSSCANMPAKDLKTLYPDASCESVDLLQWTLRFGPAERPTATDALQHDYLEQLHCPEDEPSRRPVDQSEFEIERRKVSLATMREELFRDILHYYPEKRDEYLAANAEYSLKNSRLLERGESLYECETDVTEKRSGS